jgi:hypothetical protein
LPSFSRAYRFALFLCSAHTPKSSRRHSLARFPQCYFVTIEHVLSPAQSVTQRPQAREHPACCRQYCQFPSSICSRDVVCVFVCLCLCVFIRTACLYLRICSFTQPVVFCFTYRLLLHLSSFASHIVFCFTYRLLLHISSFASHIVFYSTGRLLLHLIITYSTYPSFFFFQIRIADFGLSNLMRDGLFLKTRCVNDAVDTVMMMCC